MHHLQRGIAAAVLVGALAACGSSPAPTTVPSPPSAQPTTAASESSSAQPSASAAPNAAVASPSPSAAIDVSGLLARHLASPLAFDARVVGTITTGGKTEDVAGAYAQESGQAYRLKLSVGPAASARTTEIIRIGSHWERRTGLGLFFEEKPNVSESLASTLSKLSDLTDMGVDTGQFAGAHRVTTSTPPLTTAILPGLADGAPNSKATVDVYANAGGAPVGFVVNASWDVKVGSKTQKANANLLFQITNLGSATGVTEPEVVHRVYQSKRFGFKIAVPNDWTVKPGTAKFFDLVYSADTDELQGFRQAANGYSLNNWTSLYIRDDRKDHTGFKVTSNKLTKLAGVAARRVVFDWVSKQGNKVHGVELFAVKGRYLYIVLYQTYGGDPKLAEAAFGRLLTTYSFG